MLSCHFLRSKFRNAGLAAEQEQPAAGLFQNGKQAISKIDTRNLLLKRCFEQFGCQNDTRTVRQNKIGIIDKRTQFFVVQRLLGNLSIRGHDIAGLFARKNFLCARGGLVHRDIIKLQPHDIQFHVQAYLTNLELFLF